MNKISNGVYILHESLGVKTVEDWNPKNNKGAIGILLIEDEHKIVVALENSPKKLNWSKELVLGANRPVVEIEDAESDFNGEEYCKNLNSPNYPAAYYCLNYKKGGRSWYLPSSGELWLIYNHLEEIQTALSTVEGQRLVNKLSYDFPCYWSSTESGVPYAWHLYLTYNERGYLGWHNKVSNTCNCKVRPISKFNIN